MGKVTLAVLVVAIALGVYWFWWSDQGANNPITVEGTLSGPGVAMIAGMQGAQKVDFSLQAVPGKIRVGRRLQGTRVSAIINLSKREFYVLNESEKTYAQEEFDLVDMSQTKPPEKSELAWPKELKRTPEWDYIGSGEGKRFCNKQTFTGLPSELMDAAKAAPGAGAALPQMNALASAVKGEMWFTPETRLGRRYFSTLNKLLRWRQVGSGMKESQKRPQVKYVNLDYFPLPMKAVTSFGPMRIEMNVKNLSRKKIPKDVFQVPSGYTKVSMKEVMQ